MDCPRNATELRMFIDCVNYYCDKWLSCAHILKPLTVQSGLKKKAPINWTDKMQKAFKKWACLWLPMLLQLLPTTISGLAHTMMPLIFS
jgi:hypothetical protein